MIVKMKKAQICVLKESHEALLKSLQRCGELMIIEAESEKGKTNHYNANLSKAEKSLNLLKKYQAKKNSKYYETSYKELIKKDSKRLKIVEKIEELDEEIIELNNVNLTLSEEINQLKLWEKLDIKLSKLSSFNYCINHFGIIEKNNLDKISIILNEFDSNMHLMDQKTNEAAILITNMKNDDFMIMEKIKNIGFNEIILPKDNKKIVEIITEKEQTINRNLEKIKSNQDQLFALTNNINDLKMLNDQLLLEQEIQNINLTQTQETVYIEGWVRADRLHRLEKAIKDATNIYELYITNPTEEDNPPTALKNISVVSPFETITDMFAKPGYREVDPNITVAIWYWIIFGMMMGDIAYGILLFVGLGLFILIKGRKRKLSKLIYVLFLSSITTMIWGFIYGSFFSYEIYTPLLRPMSENSDDTILLLFACLGIGVLHIVTGLLFKAYINIKNKDLMSAVCDQFTWVMILICTPLAAFAYITNSNLIANNLPSDSKLVSSYTLALIMIIISVIIILFTAGRNKKNIFGKIIGGLGSLYGITGYVSDILSYSRILALAMSSAIIGFVMNMLAGMVLNGIAGDNWVNAGVLGVIGIICFILISTLGHVFNLAMGLLSAYVHDGRLQYIEYFNKFYDGNGYEFKPLSIKLKYVDGINDKLGGN